MDLRQYLFVPIRRYKEVIAVMLIFLALSIYFTSIQKTVYPVTMFYTISLEDSQETTDFKYSNFYAEHSSLEFSRTVSGWFDDPSFEAQTFIDSNINKDEEMTFVKKLFGFFKAKRVERQNIQVSFDTYEDAKSHKLADTLTKVLKGRLSEYNKQSNSHYQVALTSKWVEKKEASILMSVTISILMGLLIGVLLMYLYEYFAGKISTTYQAEEIFENECVEQSCKCSYPTSYLKKFVKLEKINSVLCVGFSPKRKISEIKESLSFPLDIDKLDESKKTLVVVRLGCSKSEDLKKISKLINKGNREFVVLS